MLKKCASIAIMLGMCLMLVSAAEKRDTATVNQLSTSKQLLNNALAKQTNIRPVKSSTWSKIKDLFM